MRENFWELPLDALTRPEWEALCDGCGKCCLHKAEDAETGEVLSTNIACRLLDRESCRCSDYRHRKIFVPDCVRLTRLNVGKLSWLPSTCAYRLRSEGRPLPDWHYLKSGDRDSVHDAGMSVRGWTVAEDEAGSYEHHLIDREL
ncbi:MAG TPA: YcgN family cysteine cluster protein [Allosphingosinicella sp.]|uniref:YcgN family cysteine cluster protein n=1 Tax=Allosphingosinicella sp. TaxID=2823234 RepID=UPI002EDB3EEB